MVDLEIFLPAFTRFSPSALTRNSDKRTQKGNTWDKRDDFVTAMILFKLNLALFG